MEVRSQLQRANNSTSQTLCWMILWDDYDRAMDIVQESKVKALCTEYYFNNCADEAFSSAENLGQATDPTDTVCDHLLSGNSGIQQTSYC